MKVNTVLRERFLIRLTKIANGENGYFYDEKLHRCFEMYFPNSTFNWEFTGRRYSIRRISNAFDTY